ncbi:MAG: DUF4931 domain-containing protein [Planctomycetota bacterium]
MRRDPIVGRQVLIAEDRATRPNDFLGQKTASDRNDSPADCPFCAGHEDETPAELLEVRDHDGNWQVRVVPNKYPAVSLVADEGGPFGTHEVFIESPRHVGDITELTDDEFAGVLRVYRRRLRHWSIDERISHCSIFKNVGSAAGASLEHVHSQLIALPTIPPVLKAELSGAEAHYRQYGCCRFCQLIDEELAERKRLVAATDQFVAFCAYAGRQPFETWILPRTHASSFNRLSDAQALDLARLMRQIVGRLQTQFVPLAYNLMLHTAPYRHASADYYHWHLEVLPRSTQLAGFEWGTGVHINPLSPERAAAKLSLIGGK